MDECEWKTRSPIHLLSLSRDMPVGILADGHHTNMAAGCGPEQFGPRML